MNKKISHSEFDSFNGIVQLINKHFWKAFVGPFFAFLYPIVFVAVLGTIFNYEMVLAGSISIGPLAVACVALPTAIFEFKKSTLLKRIGTTSIKPMTFLSYTASFYFLIMIASGLWTTIFSMMIFGKYWNTGRIMYSVGNVDIKINSLKEIFAKIEWAGYIYSFIVLTLVSTAVGLFLVSISKSILMIQAFGSSLLIFTMFLTGQVLPLAQIANVQSMWYLSYLTPFKSAIVQNTMSFNGLGKLSNEYTLNNLEIDGSSAIYNLNEIKYYISNIDKGIKTPEKVVGYLSLQYSKYNIFDINKTYYAVDGLSTVQPAIVKVSELEKVNSELKPLESVLIKMPEFKNSYIQLTAGSIGNKSLVQIGNSIENSLNFALPYLWIVTLFLISMKSFTWNIR
ncbi:hypothetical protein [Mycoplasma sp. Mirounga ES2805-ORL]|uniref:hypothetical protein n=1 Tax=Mycoplasma sp. Mirounga ES2805-ORL TaxID=754514 RepID=UPI00197C29F3|nr:hypothetical protein [Mycoplasma sp. Mirounga ES2805-ORL]QSF13495.1 hypothetical protein JXZ90_02350 [Mycoplasma sp. Mirounga ES2805-ORL]